MSARSSIPLADVWLPLLLILLTCTHSSLTVAQSSSTGADDSSSSGLSEVSSTGRDNSTINNTSGSNSSGPFDSSSSSGPFASANSTNSTNSSVAGSSSSSSSSSTAVPPSVLSSTGRGGEIIPGGSIGSVSSFGSTDAIFFTTIRDVWIGVILWTMVFTAFFFGAAGAIAVRVNRAKHCGCKIFLILPAMLVVGAVVGFVHGAVSAALIAAITISIPYPVGIDIAAGLGIGIAICITYFHLGRADFIHR